MIVISTSLAKVAINNKDVRTEERVRTVSEKVSGQAVGALLLRSGSAITTGFLLKVQLDSTQISMQVIKNVTFAHH
jgi:hypothetical protein